MLTKEKEILFNVIETYRDMPYLWDKSHRNYRNQELRKEGNKILFEIYKEFDSRATVRNLVKKVQNLRTTFFKELRKVKSSIRSGAEPVYIPTLWYFEAMSFLASGRASEDLNDTENTHDHEDRSRQSDLHTTEYDDNSSTSSHRNEPIHVFPMNKKRRLKKVLKTEIDDSFTIDVSPRESKVPIGMSKEEDNECDLYAQLLAQKLKRIDEDQRLVLMNEIDNLVFKSVMSCKAREPSSVFFTMVDSNADTEEV